ncbi:MAG: hypothetical protein ACFFG0_56960, partial [Candidatus Thorarchaeota archaeon]
IIQYLITEHYIDKLSEEEIISIIDNTKFIENFLKLNKIRDTASFISFCSRFGSNLLKHVLIQIILNHNLNTYLQPLLLSINRSFGDLLSRALAEIILDIEHKNLDIKIEKVNNLINCDVFKYVNDKDMPYLSKNTTHSFHRNSTYDPNFLKLYNEVSKTYDLKRGKKSMIKRKG